MEYRIDAFSRYSSESQRVVANLEQAYLAWVETRRQLEAMPVSMYWVDKTGVEYLGAKWHSKDSGTAARRKGGAVPAIAPAFVAGPAGRNSAPPRHRGNAGH